MREYIDEARSYFKTPLYYIILLNKNQIMLCFAWGRSAREGFSFIIAYFFILFKFGSHMENRSGPDRDGAKRFHIFEPIGAHMSFRENQVAYRGHFCQQNFAIWGIRSEIRSLHSVPGPVISHNFGRNKPRIFVYYAS